METSMELYHHGVKGMKWGIRKKDSRVAKKLKSYSDTSNDPKTDFLKINRPNSAARNYYRAQRAKTFITYRKNTAIMDRKISGLSKEQIENGRYRVSRARNIRRKILSGATGSAAGIATAGALLGPGATAAMIPVALLMGPAGGALVGAGMNYVTGGHYYQRESATYGSRRAKRELNQK